MVLSGRSRLGEVPRRTTRVRGAAPHPDDDRDRDAEPDEDVADAEHVVEGQQRRQREDVGQRRQVGALEAGT